MGFAFVLGAIAAGAAGTVACGGEDFDSCEANATCPPGTGGTDGGTGGSGGSGGTSGTGGTGNTGGTGGAGGTGGTGGTGGDGGGCDTSKTPSEEACLVADEFGVFVSPTGDDSANDGTKSKPFKTIGKALTTAGTAGKNVYACDDGTGITESATMAVSAAHDKHGIYGGFDCTSWGWSATAKAKVSGAPVALTISNIATSFKVENLDITAANAANSGESSFGAIVASSKGVVFASVNVTAGEGKAGGAGSNGTPGADGADATAAQNGTAATCTSAPPSQDGGKWPGASPCGAYGGDGGKALKAAAGQKGSAGIPQTNVTPASVDNGGAAGTGTGNGNPGQPGSNGNAGTLGAVAAANGSFTSTGFTPASGNDGGDGFPGQGGGGGGASSSSSASCIGASGGAGGMGGCGGGKGTGGKGGGASVALLSWQSEVS
ncbi:MAG: hypothetical protein KJ015_41295, partial [Myxococcales bacterium]|nr:hypothetical protein [Myxococcales bacterium]